MKVILDNEDISRLNEIIGRAVITTIFQEFFKTNLKENKNGNGH
jgi:hypothetical protein